MAIHGNLATMPLSELLLWAGGNGKTGMLRLEQDGVATKLFFEEGRICACISDDPPFLLGQFLLFRGVISERVLRAAMAEQQCSGASLTEVLVDMGTVSNADLDREVGQKAEETILSLFHWSESASMFWFRENTRPGPKAMRVDLDVDSLLRHGALRTADLARVREAFPSNQIVPVRIGQVPDPEKIGDFPSYQIYLAIDGVRSIARIAPLVHGTEFQVGRRLLSMLEAGIVGVKDEFEPPARVTREPAAEANPPLAGESEAETIPEIVFVSEPTPQLRPEREAEPGIDLSSDSEDGLEFALDEEPSEIPSIDTEGRTAPSTSPSTPAEELSLDLESLAREVIPPAQTEESLEVSPEADEKSLVEEEAISVPETVLVEEGPAVEPKTTSLAEDAPPAGPEPPLPEATPDRPTEAVFASPSEVMDESEAENAVRVMETHLQRARQLSESSRPEAALEELGQAQEVDPGHPSLSVLRSGAEGAIVEGLLGNGLVPQRIPTVVASADQVSRAELTPAQEYLIGQVNGEWDVQTLLSVAPLRPVELLSALHGLVRRGIVELHDPPGGPGGAEGPE
jgi:hypothetical protein